MKIKLFKKEKKFKKESPLLNLHFYWKLAVCIMCIVTTASAFFGYYLFMKINKELTPSPADMSAEKSETLKKERIGKRLEYFTLREEKSNQILYSGAPVIDPSL